MGDHRTTPIGRAPTRDDRRQEQVDASKGRPPPKRQPQGEFDRVMRDAKKPVAKAPDKKSATKGKKEPSLFELSKAGRDLVGNKTTKKKGDFSAAEPGVKDATDEEQAKASLAILADGKQKPETELGSQKEQKDTQAKLANSEEKAKEALAQMGIQDQKDVPAGFKVNETTAAQKDLKLVIKQIADHLTVVRSAEKLETSITIKHPPIFEGATIKMTEFASAKGEYNLTFSNLSHNAKLLVDSMQNQDMLKQNLEAKGFAVHIITTTQEQDNIISQMEAAYNRGEDEAGDEGERREGQEEEEEEQA